MAVQYDGDTADDDERDPSIVERAEDRLEHHHMQYAEAATGGCVQGGAVRGDRDGVDPAMR